MNNTIATNEPTVEPTTESTNEPTTKPTIEATNQPTAEPITEAASTKPTNPTYPISTQTPVKKQHINSNTFVKTSCMLYGQTNHKSQTGVYFCVTCE